MNDTKILKRSSMLEPVISVREIADEAHYWIIDISDQIFGTELYARALNVLNTADEKDTVHIILNTPGGAVSTCMSMITAMQQCKAKNLITENIGHAYSSGAYIWSFGKELRMGPFARAMFHTSSHGDGGRTRDIKERAVALEAMTSHLLARVIKLGILTQEEADAAFAGKKDMYYTLDDLKDRMAKVNGGSDEDAA